VRTPLIRLELGRGRAGIPARNPRRAPQEDEGRALGVNLEPMQLAALLLETTTEQLNEHEAAELVRPKRLARH